MEPLLTVLALVMMLAGAVAIGIGMAKARGCPALLGAALFTTGIVLLGMMTWGGAS